MYTINVLIITYKQEGLIGRALESVLCQKEWGLKNIIICDDCSPDGTWDVVKKYKTQYPSIITSIRNEKNLGIYGNKAKIIDNRGDADLYYILAGDDTICDGWFKTVQNNLSNNNIEIKGKAALICSDFKIVRPSGICITFRNNLVTKNYSKVSMVERGLVKVRSILMTSETISRFEQLEVTKGMCIAEEMDVIQPFKHADLFYYVPYIASVYYSHIGVTASLYNVNYYKERKDAYRWVKDNYKLDNKCNLYLDYQIASLDFLTLPSFKSYIKCISVFWKSFDRYTFHGASGVIVVLSHIRMIKHLIKSFFK